MIRALVCAALLALPSSAVPTRATHPMPTPPPPHPHYRVVIDPIVRSLLADLWDDSTATQPERAYCAAYIVDASSWVETVYRVWALAPAATLSADPYHVIARCPAGPGVVLVHVHPPATCDRMGRCVLGGVDAWECFPSDEDQRMVDHFGDAFSLIQCSRHALIAVYPTSTPPGR